MAPGPSSWLANSTLEKILSDDCGVRSWEPKLYGLRAGKSQTKLPLNQTGQAVFGEFLRRLGWEFFVGPRFFWGNSFITLRPTNLETVPLPPDLGLHTALTAIGFRLQRDTRLNRFYPTNGTLLDFTSDFFSQGLGSKYSFQSYKFTFNKHRSLTKQVLAYNGSLVLPEDSLRSTGIASTEQIMNFGAILRGVISTVIWLQRN